MNAYNVNVMYAPYEGSTCVKWTWELTENISERLSFSESSCILSQIYFSQFKAALQNVTFEVVDSEISSNILLDKRPAERFQVNTSQGRCINIVFVQTWEHYLRLDYFKWTIY